jgi:hypothetical protein
MFSAQEGLCLDGAVTGLLLVPFEDDELRGRVTPPAVTRAGGIVGVVPFGARGLGFVGSVARFLHLSLALAVLSISGLFLSPRLGIDHVQTWDENGITLWS